MRELSSRKAARLRNFLLINSLRHLLCKCHLPQEGGFRAVGDARPYNHVPT